MQDMTTRVELTPRTTRSDNLNEGKLTRSYVSPLSDASNKSSDSNMSSSLILEETTVVASKTVNMFNSGIKPRISPRPFTREKPPENRTAGLISALSTDVNPQSNVPFQTSTSISLSGSPKSEEHERVGRRIFTSVRQLNTEEEVKSDASSAEKQPSSWLDEPKVTSKPPLMSRKLDSSQQQEKRSGKNATNDADEQKEVLEKATFSSFQNDSMDSLSVRSQLRQKRRPVSAMFLDSINDPTAESKVVDTLKTSYRRPLSEDLTSIFERRGFGNKTEIPSEESKENRPLKRNSFNRSITEDQTDVASKAGEFSSPRSSSSQTSISTSGISSRSMFSARGAKVTTEVKSNNQQEKVPDNDAVEKRSGNSISQGSKVLSDYSESLTSTSEGKNADDGGIAPGITKRRISLYLANSDSSIDSVDLPVNKEDKNNAGSVRTTKATVSDKDMESGRPWRTSKSQDADLFKTFSTSSPSVEPKSEKTNEEKSAVLQDYSVQKEKRDWRTSDVHEEKQLTTRRSFKKIDEPLHFEDNKNILKEGKANTLKNNQYSSKTEDADSKYKKPAQFDNTSRTVKATMFEHNVERHSPPEVFSAINTTVGESARSGILPQSFEVKNEAGDWSKWLSGKSVNSVAEFRKDRDIERGKSSESGVMIPSSENRKDDLQKKLYEKRPVEPRYEVIQAVGERVLSESIHMAPEDKAVTLRSRRSFHRKEKEFGNVESEHGVFSRPASGLQRSKSEYRKRVTQESTQERSAEKYFSSDLDFPFRKNRAEKSEVLKVADKTYETTQNKSIVDTSVSDGRQKFYKLDYKPKRDSTLDQVSTKQSFDISTDSKEMKTSLNDYRWQKYNSSDLADKSKEDGPTNIFKDEQTLIRSNLKDDIKKTTNMEDLNKQTPQRNRFPSDRDSLPIQKENNIESSTLLNKEIQEIKKDLTVTKPTKELDAVSSKSQFKQEFTELKWERKKAPLQDQNTSGDGTGSTLDKKYETTQNRNIIDTSVSDGQQKFYKPKRDSTLDQVSTKQSYEIGTDSKEMKTSLNDYSWQKYNYSDLADKRKEDGPRNIFKDEQTLIRSNLKDDIKKTQNVEGLNKQTPPRNRFPSDRDLLPVQKENNAECKDVLSTMLNKEIQEIKKDLTVTKPSKEMDAVSSKSPFKEEFSEPRWERKKAPLQDKNTSGYGTGSTLEAFTSEKLSMSTMKDSPRAESKATYFAVTGLDNTKIKRDSILDGHGNPASSWSSDQYFKPESRLNTTYWGSESNYKSEDKSIQGDLGNSSASRELTYTHQKNNQEDSVCKVENPSEKRSVIDIDAMIRRRRQKPGQDDKSSTCKDIHTKQELKISETGPLQSSPLNLDGSYKSKVVDIDSLMADYSAGHRKDDNANIYKWERSRSFKESASKGSSSKWKDPSVKHIATEESYQYETVGSWYSSRESTSIKQDLKQDRNKSTNIVGPIHAPTEKKYSDKGKEDQHFQAPGKGLNLTTFDSLLESPITVMAEPSTSRNLVKPTVIEMSVDGEPDNVSETMTLQHWTSMQTKKYVSSEEVQTAKKTVSSEVQTTKYMSSGDRHPPSEVRQPAKASDLITSMLENKEKHRTKQSLPVEHPLETQRFKYQQEWHYSESKDYSVKEVSSQRTKPRQEQKIDTDLPWRRSLNRQKEQDMKSEQDHVKQCFSRSSTSTKDTDSLVQDPEQKYGTWNQDKPTEDSCATESPSYDNSSRKQHSHSRLSSLSHTETDQHDSITEARDASLDRCSMDSTDGTESTPSVNEAKGSDFPFVEQSSVLDSTALKNRVQLSRMSQRRAPSQLQRRSRLLQPSSQLAVIEDTDNPWMYTDSTEVKPEKKDEDEEEEKPKRTSVHSPRMPVFPGMDHSALVAQLRKRQDAEGSSESSPQTKSPKSPLPHGTLGVKLLPTPGDKQDKGAGESPQWLKELKTKKRLSQYEPSS